MTLPQIIPPGLVTALGVAAAFSFAVPRPVGAQTAATVSVRVDAPVAPIQFPAFGVNTAVWNPFMADPPLPGLYRAAGVTALRFPGGSTADVYHWQTHSSTAGSGAYVNPKNTFDAFMRVAQQSGAEPIITVNYGSNPQGTGGADPAEAAAWVDYANNTKKYGVKYWEIGNEIYGNNQYGNKWETDLHADQSPTEYGRNVLLFRQAMKAKDPTIKIGAVLAVPGNWPDGREPDWNSNVLAVCGAAVDFVVIHPYPQEPGQENDTTLLAATSQYPTKMGKLRAQIDRYCGVNAPNLPVFVTELNSVSSKPGKQSVGVVNALFLADAFPAWLENGAANVEWWASHNGKVTNGNNSESLHGTATYGDYGFLSSGSHPEAAAETPFPAYYGFQMVSKLGKPGDLLVSAASSEKLLAAHAVWQADGHLAVLLVNKDPVNSFTVDVSIVGYAPATASTDYSYGQTSGTGGMSSQPGIAGNSYQRTVTPYSMTTIVMQPRAAAPAPTPAPPTGSVDKTGE